MFASISSGDIQKTVVVDVGQTHTIVFALRVAKRLAIKKVLVQALLRFAEVEELHLLAVLGDGVVNDVHHLIVANPSVRMKHKAVDALLMHGDVERRLHVLDGDRVVGLVQMLGFPVAGHHARELPTRAINHVRIRVVLDEVVEAILGRRVALMRDVLAEPITASVVQNQLAGDGLVVLRKHIEHGRGQRQEVPVQRPFAEDLGVKPRAHRVERIAARHAKCNWFVARNLSQHVHATVVRGFGLSEIAAVEEWARMVDGVDFDAEPFVNPGPQLWVIRLHATRHDADGSTAIDLLQALKDRTQITFVLCRVAHVVDRQDHDGFNTVFTDPLRSGQLREPGMWIPRVVVIEVGQAVVVSEDCRG